MPQQEDPQEALNEIERMQSKILFWPTDIFCEMDIAIWERELRSAGIREEYADVIDGFINGFHQGILHHTIDTGTGFFTPENHQSAKQAQKKIEDNITQEVLAGRMYSPYTHAQVAEHYPFFRSNPLGAVVNGDGSFRPTNDLSFPHGDPETPSVNSFVDKSDYKTTWDDFNVVSRFIRGAPTNIQLALFDW
jgi:hypothetical protein